MKGEQIGFIAQDVETVLPQTVLTANDADKTKGIKYDELIPVLTKALQELKSEDDNLRATLKTATDNLADESKKANDGAAADAKAIDELRRELEAYQKAHP